MECAKEKEKLQLEYDLYEVGNVSSASNVASMLSINLEEVDVTRSYIAFERKRNRRRRVISDVLGKCAEKCGYLSPWSYCLDDTCLDRKSEVLDRYYGQLNDICHEINDDNFQELYRLMSFARKKTRDYRVAIENERKTIRNGATYEDLSKSKALAESDEFVEWFSEALPKASCVERVEKIKK